jgi:predicted Zn-dependent protease
MSAVFSRLMLAHHRTGDQQQALEYGQIATTRTPDDPQTWLMYAEVLGGANRVDEALRALDRVTTLNPQMSGVSARRAVLLLDAGRPAEAAAVRAGRHRAGRPAAGHGRAAWPSRSRCGGTS